MDSNSTVSYDYDFLLSTLEIKYSTGNLVDKTCILAQLTNDSLFWYKDHDSQIVSSETTIGPIDFKFDIYMDESKRLNLKTTCEIGKAKQIQEQKISDIKSGFDLAKVSIKKLIHDLLLYIKGCEFDSHFTTDALKGYLEARYES